MNCQRSIICNVRAPSHGVSLNSRMPSHLSSFHKTPGILYPLSRPPYSRPSWTLKKEQMLLGCCKIPGSISHCDSGKPGRAGLVARLKILLVYLRPGVACQLTGNAERTLGEPRLILRRFLEERSWETLAAAPGRSSLPLQAPGPPSKKWHKCLTADPFDSVRLLLLIPQQEAGSFLSVDSESVAFGYFFLF